MQTMTLCLVALVAGAITAAAQQSNPPADAPISWLAAANDPGDQRAVTASAALEPTRDSLLALRKQRGRADAAAGAGLDVMLDLHEPLLIYSGYMSRPFQGMDLPWRTKLEKAGNRTASTKVEFQPVREEARLTLQRRGGIPV